MTMPWSVTLMSTGCIVVGRPPPSNRRRPDPEHQRVCHQAEAVDELVLQERLQQVAAAPDLELVTGLVLQCLHGGDQVTGHEASGVGVLAAPRRFVFGERVRHDVLGQRVDRRGDRVVGLGLVGPVAAEDVERPATEQERTGVAVQLGHELAERRVGERRLPPPVLEPVAGIFVGAARGLHHAIEGQERLHGELHGDEDGSTDRN